MPLTLGHMPFSSENAAAASAHRHARDQNGDPGGIAGQVAGHLDDDQKRGRGKGQAGAGRDDGPQADAALELRRRSTPIASRSRSPAARCPPPALGCAASRRCRARSGRPRRRRPASGCPTVDWIAMIGGGRRSRLDVTVPSLVISVCIVRRDPSAWICRIRFQSLIIAIRRSFSLQLCANDSRLSLQFAHRGIMAHFAARFASSSASFRTCETRPASRAARSSLRNRAGVISAGGFPIKATSAASIKFVPPETPSISGVVVIDPGDARVCKSREALRAGRIGDDAFAAQAAPAGGAGSNGRPRR